MPPPRNTPWLHREGLVNGVKWHWVEAGEPSQPLVLLIHGFGACWYAWRDTLSALTSGAYAEHRYRVVAIDCKGYNLSDKPLGGYDLVTLAYDIAQLLLILRPAAHTKTTLVGHDYGGLIAWATAALHPESIDKLVILNAPHPTQLATTRLGWKYRFAARHYYLAQVSCFAEYFFSWKHASWLNWYLASPNETKRTVVDEDLMKVYRSAASGPGAVAGLLRHARSLPRSLRRHGINLPQILVPTLVFAGEVDTTWPVKQWTKTESLSEYFAFAYMLRTIVLPACGHFVHHEMPDAFHQHLQSFLAE